MSLRNRVIILAYHSIEDDPDDPLAIAPRVFEAQMAWLVAAGFRVIALGEALRRLHEPDANLRRCVVLTFDDGYANFGEHAVPVMEKFGLTATVFVVTDKTGQKSDWNRSSPSRPLMSLADLQVLARRGFWMGSHSASHARLTDLSVDHLRSEAQRSKAFLEDRIGITELTFCYPYGAYSEREKQIIREAGYLCACKTRGMWGNNSRSDYFSLSRAELYSHHSLQQFRSIVRGFPWPLLVDSGMRFAFAASRLYRSSFRHRG